MIFLPAAKKIQWTLHSRAKMRFYKLSEARVLRVINSPKRVEEGIAPKTVALMQPASYKSVGKNEDWKQEIWVMVQKLRTNADGTRNNAEKLIGRRKSAVIKVISVWRYPGKTKPKDEAALNFLRQEYSDYLNKAEEDKSRLRKSISKSKWF